MSVQTQSRIPQQDLVRLLILESDEQLRTGLLEHFRSANYTTTTVSDAETALHYLSQSPGYEIALLDLMLPDKSGVDLLFEAQQLPIDTSFLIVSAHASLEERLHGHSLGVADYIVKPFQMEEVEARVEDVLHRRRAPTSNGPRVYTHDNLRIDLASRTCLRDDQQIPLTTLEFQVLEYLVENRGRVVPRDELRSAVWKDEGAISLRTIDRHVAKIREKIEPDPEMPMFLHTVYGKGYEFVRPEPAQ